MDAGAEAQVLVGIAREVEFFRRGEFCRVAIGRSDQQKDRRAGGNRGAAKLDRLSS